MNWKWDYLSFLIGATAIFVLVEIADRVQINPSRDAETYEVMANKNGMFVIGSGAIRSADISYLQPLPDGTVAIIMSNGDSFPANRSREDVLEMMNKVW